MLQIETGSSFKGVERRRYFSCPIDDSVDILLRDRCVELVFNYVLVDCFYYFAQKVHSSTEMAIII